MLSRNTVRTLATSSYAVAASDGNVIHVVRVFPRVRSAAVASCARDTVADVLLSGGTD